MDVRGRGRVVCSIRPTMVRADNVRMSPEANATWTTPCGCAWTMSAQLRIRPFASADAGILRAARPSSSVAAMPHLARGSLPILSDEKGLAMAPLMDYCRPDIANLRGMIVQMAWKPRHGIAESGCFIT